MVSTRVRSRDLSYPSGPKLRRRLQEETWRGCAIAAGLDGPGKVFTQLFYVLQGRPPNCSNHGTTTPAPARPQPQPARTGAVTVGRIGQPRPPAGLTPASRPPRRPTTAARSRHRARGAASPDGLGATRSGHKGTGSGMPAAIAAVQEQGELQPAACRNPGGSRTRWGGSGRSQALTSPRWGGSERTPELHAGGRRSWQ